MRQARVTITMEVLLELDDNIESDQLDQIVHEDLRVMSNTTIVDVVDYSVLHWFIGSHRCEIEGDKGCT